ncbi:RNA polymerase sigma factor [Marilutibacter maris]|uniref:RNA polymerase sigma70 n=1 Tax=Marilutibacter maris TaxID=1605891 RepID=A0A2U9T7N7_9GAMM|nr:RNA polymerase sigma factor [Lysobacter maris]AWV08581.1 RNA polymerase sigma70 [Lysobacter maris]
MRAEDRMFIEAWNRTRPELLRRARRLAEGHADRADDLMSATAIKALMFMRRSPEAMTDPDGFLFVVLRHVFLDSVRRQSRERAVIDESADVQDEHTHASGSLALSQTQRLELHEQLDSVVSAVKRLTREQRQLFGMRFVEELSYPVIAEQLQVSEALARKRVQLLRARLRGRRQEAS